VESSTRLSGEPLVGGSSAVASITAPLRPQKSLGGKTEAFLAPRTFCGAAEKRPARLLDDDELHAAIHRGGGPVGIAHRFEASF